MLINIWNGAAILNEDATAHGWVSAFIHQSKNDKIISLMGALGIRETINKQKLIKIKSY